MASSLGEGPRARGAPAILRCREGGCLSKVAAASNRPSRFRMKPETVYESGLVHARSYKDNAAAGVERSRIERPGPLPSPPRGQGWQLIVGDAELPRASRAARPVSPTAPDGGPAARRPPPSSGHLRLPPHAGALHRYLRTQSAFHRTTCGSMTPMATPWIVPAAPSAGWRRHGRPEHGLLDGHARVVRAQEHGARGRVESPAHRAHPFEVRRQQPPGLR